MSKTDAPILELSTLAPDRPEILLHWTGEPDGKLYEMVQFEDLSLEDLATIGRYGDTIKDLEKLKNANQITPPQAKKLAEALGALIIALIPSLEDQAYAELSDGAKAKIIEAFMLASPELLAKVREANQSMIDAKTSGARSRGSKPSTEATKTSGSGSRSANSAST